MLGPIPEYFRASERRPAWAEVRLISKDHISASGVIGNISLGGMHVEVDNGLPPVGDVLRLEFELPGEGGQTHHCTARVTHVDDHGVGLEFDNYDPQTIDALRAMMVSTINHH